MKQSPPSTVADALKSPVGFVARFVRPEITLSFFRRGRPLVGQPSPSLIQCSCCVARRPTRPSNAAGPAEPTSRPPSKSRDGDGIQQFGPSLRLAACRLVFDQIPPSGSAISTMSASISPITAASTHHTVSGMLAILAEVDARVPPVRFGALLLAAGATRVAGSSTRGPETPGMASPYLGPGCRAHALHGGDQARPP
jgi:hypothetical protein